MSPINDQPPLRDWNPLYPLYQPPIQSMWHWPSTTYTAEPEFSDNGYTGKHRLIDN